ncbi:hypothetical protein B0H14DRAFT_2759781 [Mycena olivaceomarginata]|nr:hypothetical protein B0H14DRAFT_2759781 [Mycena olivaceomarginata]
MAPPLPISSLIVEDWFHGLYTAAMLVTFRTIVISKRYSGSQRKNRIGLVLAAYICSTMHAALNWVYYSKAVDDNELPTGPGLLYSLTHLKVWLEGTGDTFFCINIFMADCLFIWRCWVVWNRRWPVVVLPILATIAGAVLAGFIISDQVGALRSSEAFTVAKKSAEFVRLSTIYFSLSVATSLTTTLLISLRILLLRRTLRKTETGHTFNPLLEIPIESALLYSVTLLTFVALDVRKDANLYYAQNIHAQMTGLAPLLIILRDAAGYSRPVEEWRMKLSGDSANASTATDSKNDAEP